MSRETDFLKRTEKALANVSRSNSSTYYKFQAGINLLGRLSSVVSKFDSNMQIEQNETTKPHTKALRQGIDH
jgi:hypothetical protein